MRGRVILCWACVAATGCAPRANEKVGSPSQVEAGAEQATEGRSLPALQGPPVPLLGTRHCFGDGAEACSPALLPTACEEGTDADCAADPLRVTLAWVTGADLNLHLIDPAGEVISQARVQSASGGHLDRISRGRCDRLRDPQPEALPEGAEPTGGGVHVERVRWARVPPKGRYRVEVYYWGECNSGAGPTSVQVSIAVGADVHRFEHTVLPAERVTLVQFDLH